MLRPPREGDVETLVEVCVDPEIVRFTRVPSPYARSDAEAFLAAAQEGLVRGDSFLVVIADRETDALLGTISLGIHRASVAPENVASQRVAEKAGFMQEGILRSYREIRGVRRDLVAYSLLPGDLAER